MKRLLALGGVLGPAAFISGWITSAAVTDRDYSSVDDAISRLAAIGADTRPLMTAAFIGFGVALPAFALALRRSVPGPAWITAGLTGLSTLAVAAAPLDRSARIDQLHGVFAGFGYVTLALTPLLAARPLWRLGLRGLATGGVVAGAVSTVSLALTLTDLPTGFVQRLGLTASDIWIVATALVILIVGPDGTVFGRDAG